jgi:hypothetical protein
MKHYTIEVPIAAKLTIWLEDSPLSEDQAKAKALELAEAAFDALDYQTFGPAISAALADEDDTQAELVYHPVNKLHEGGGVWLVDTPSEVTIIDVENAD